MQQRFDQLSFCQKINKQNIESNALLNYIAIFLFYKKMHHIFSIDFLMESLHVGFEKNNFDFSYKPPFYFIRIIPKYQMIHRFLYQFSKRMSKNKNIGDWTWIQEKTCLIGTSPGVLGLEKIASFDMDDTVITRKSGAKFPKDADDWILLNGKVAPKIKELYNDGYKIVIFTNQAGIQKGKTRASDIKKKVQSIAKELDIEMQVFVASHEDEYRKPGTKMWDSLLDNNDGVKIFKEKSFFCGDAAGRINGKVRDFSDSDLKFALNVGIQFKTPENLFFGQVGAIEVKGFNPATISEAGEVIVGKGSKVDFVQKEMIILVGSPASGKSTFWRNYLSKYSRVNRDTLKTKQKCYKVAEQQIKKGNSLVIDNTNPKKDDRAYFIGLAKKYDYKVRCFEFLTPKDTCFHNDYQRVANDRREHLSGKAGTVPIHTFFKYKEQPQLNEGFYEINKVNFVAKFDNDADKQFYKKFSKK